MAAELTRRLFLANIRTDYGESVREQSGLQEHSRSGSDTSARFVWHLEPGDLLLLPDEPHQGFVDYVAGVLSVDPETIDVIVVHSALSDAGLSSEILVEQLKTLITCPADWVLEPFVLTAGVVELAERLGLTPPGGAAFAASGKLAHLNTKSGFRQSAMSVGLPLALGLTVSSKGELEAEASKLLTEVGTVILKHERGGGGRGNIGLSRVRDRGLRGTRRTVYAPTGHEHLIGELWQELVEGGQGSIVIEEYLYDGQPFYSEWYIGNSSINLVCSGEILYALDVEDSIESPEWVGLSLPDSMGFGTSARALLAAYDYMLFLQDQGYRGFANIDGLANEAGRMIFHEVNARWGGGLVASSVAERLIGPLWVNTHVLRTILDIPSRPFIDVHAVLTCRGLNFDSQEGEGVLVLSAASDLGAGSEFLLISKTKERLLKLEKDLRTAVS